MEILKVQSTEDKLNYLLQTKALIKQAIIDQGGTITENTTFREFVEQINELNVIEPEVIEEILETLREISEIEEEQNEQIQEIVAALNTKLEEADVADLRTQADSNTNRIGTNENDISTLKDRATTLENRATDLENDKANKSQVDALSSELELAKTSIQANTSDINAVKTRVESAEGNIATNTTNIETNTSDISNIKNDISELQTTVETNTADILANKAEFDQAVIDINEEVAKRLTTEAAKPLIKRVDYNSTTATFTFEDMEGNEKVVDLPLEATVKGGRYDAERKVLILVLVSDDEIEIPVSDLVDVYTGIDGTKIKVTVTNANEIKAEVKAGTIEKTDLAETLQNEISGKADKTYVDDEISTEDQKIETNKTNIEALQGRMTTAEGNISDNTTNISGLDTRLTTAEGNIATNTDNIGANTTAISDLETEVAGKLTMKELGDDLLEAAKATSAGTLVPKIFADLQYSHQYRLMLPYITISNTGVVSYGFQDIISNSVNDAATNPVTLKFVPDENDDDIYIKVEIDQSKLTEVGKVNTVNNIEPDANKNITLTAFDIEIKPGENFKDYVDSADASLSLQIADERVARTEIDEDLQSQINTKATSTALEEEAEARGLADQALSDRIDAIVIPEYSVVEATTTTGYAKTYSLTKDGVEVGAKINIPKDLVVKSGEVKVVTVADQPYEGAVVGDKYIDLEINDSSADHIYIPVKDLVDVYTGIDGDKINVSINGSNQISATIKQDTIELQDLAVTVKNRMVSDIRFGNYAPNKKLLAIKGSNNSSGTANIISSAYFESTDNSIGLVLDNNDRDLDLKVSSENVEFNPSTSGLTSTKLAPAIRELKGLVDTNTSDISDLQDAIEEAGKVDTVNNIQPDANKNITLDATQINVDETAATKVTIKSNLEDLATQIWNEHEAQDQINQYVHEDIDSLGERISNLQEELYEKEHEIDGDFINLEYRVSTEETTRENADQELQNQIDSIHIPEVPEYTIEEQAQAETGYSKTYYLTKDGTQIGSKINIPKDLVIKSGEVKTVTVADQPYEGAQVGDKYIDITLNDVNEEHIYIPVKDLVDAYTGVDGSKINVTINSQNQIEALIKTGTIDGNDLTTNLKQNLIRDINVVTFGNEYIIRHTTAAGGNKDIFSFIKTGDTEPTLLSGSMVSFNTKAEEVNFDPSTSGLTSTKLAPAIRELKGLVDNASGSVNTVNNVQPDQNKNIQLDASNINLDDTAATPETLKSIIEAQATKITTLEGKVAELESALGDIRTALELLNGVEDANNEEF